MNQFKAPSYRFMPKSIHIDWTLLGLILALALFGLLILYSASNQNMAMVLRQSVRMLVAIGIMVLLAAIPPHKYKQWAPAIFFTALSLLIAVMIMGKIGKGAQRWLDLKFFRFQPSEIMKLAVPIMLAWYAERQELPISLKSLYIGAILIAIPTLLITKQPDLGTAIMVGFAGLCVLFLAGISLRFIFSCTFISVISAPVLWHFMHGYQKKRVLTLLNPENDPLGTGYHIIQSKIAIGSGGFFGKGWLSGTQSHLNFLPEHATDFIFAVCCEEFGFIGAVALIIMIVVITLKALSISRNAQTNFTRLLAASLALTFFFSAFVNIGMVCGILPVVGIPLPLVSYGGSAMLTFLMSFGILMSISTHRILFD